MSVRRIVAAVFPLLTLAAGSRPQLQGNNAPGTDQPSRISLITRRFRAARLWLLSRPFVCCVAIGVFTMLVRLALLPWIGIPEPMINDEFSYLLGGDTFASGRVTNPSHAMWVHFETFHVLQRPTYASKYPPGQALCLALGQRVMGHPWFGVWFSAGLMCASICWMLQGWLRNGWAVLGGLLTATQIGILSPWMNSYWGGALSATGGALMLGALPRLIRASQWHHLLAAAAGFIILLNTRPYEGTLLTAAVLLAFVRWPESKSLRTRVSRLFRIDQILPTLVLLIAAFAAMSYYNFRVTGSPLSLPYIVHEKQYSYAPLFIWQTPRVEPVYRHSIMHEYWVNWSASYYFKARKQPVRVPASLMIEGRGLFCAVSDVLIIPVLVCAWLFSLPSIRAALLITAVFLIGLLQVSWVLAHYLAPLAGMFFLFAMQGLRYLRLLRPAGKTSSVNLPAVIVAVCVGSFLLAIVTRRNEPQSRFVQQRRSVLQSLTRDASRHLVIVRYPESHNIHEEWVYNAADIDGSPIVWARDMGQEENRELVKYFAGRKAWLLVPTEGAATLLPYVP